MRTSRLAQLCPFALALFFSAPGRADAAPSLTLSPLPVTPVAKGPVARAREVLRVREPRSQSLELSHVDTLPRSGGQTLVRFRQTHAQIPVLSRGASVLLDAAGDPTTFATARLEDHFPSQVAPSLTAELAAKSATSRARGSAFDAKDAELAWWPGPRGVRLVWVFYRGLTPGTPHAPVVGVDAHSGNTLFQFDATRFDRAATVYEQNPVSTPTATSVQLTTLASGATALEDARMRALNCIDTQKQVGQFGIHMCELVPKAVPDANGDFPYTFSSDVAAEDEFAEVSMYYHAAKAYDFYKSLGMPDLLEQLSVIANLRFPVGWDTFNMSLMKDTSLPLEPYDNAFFSPESPFPGMFKGIHAGLFFGQGTKADFAYDGDVVYHELGHALVDRTVNLSGLWLLDAQGSSPAPGAMNEALADYFSSALTGDGKVGEYAAKNTSFRFGDSQVIRDLDNSDSCPKNIIGEAHIDSTLFSGALWAVRQGLPASDRGTFDQALVTAMIGSSTGELAYEDLGELFRAAIEASTLGKPAADALVQELGKRGVIPTCKRVFEYKGQPLFGSEAKLAGGFFLPGRPYANLEQTEPYAPGFFQVHTTLKDTTESLKIAWDNVPLGGQYSLGPDAEPYTPAVLVRFAKDPIVFTYDSGVTSNADALLEGFQSVSLDVPKGATDAWVMVVNKGDEMGLFSSLELTQKSAAPTGGAGGSGGFSGSGAFGGAGTGGSHANTGGSTSAEELYPAGGCSTRERTRGDALIFVALGVLALGRRRRWRAADA